MLNTQTKPLSITNFQPTVSEANKKRLIENPVRNEAIELAVLGQLLRI